jgi:hypothetical protein
MRKMLVRKQSIASRMRQAGTEVDFNEAAHLFVKRRLFTVNRIGFVGQTPVPFINLIWECLDISLSCSPCAVALGVPGLARNARQFRICEICLLAIRWARFPGQLDRSQDDRTGRPFPLRSRWHVVFPRSAHCKSSRDPWTGTCKQDLYISLLPT